MHLQFLVGLFAIGIAGELRNLTEKGFTRYFHRLVSYAQTSPPVVAASDASSPVVTTLIGTASSKILPKKPDCFY